jgi:peptidoglycan/LPS O-acetylase OafA/YrhL
LAVAGKLGAWPARLLPAANPCVLLALLAIASHPAGGFMNYLRPYLAALLVGATIADARSRIAVLLASRQLRYLAEVSFALYVIHPLLAHTWLGSGEGWAKYFKRPLLFAALFGLAHLSTFQYERRWINWGRRWTDAMTPPQPARTASVVSGKGSGTS